MDATALGSLLVGAGAVVGGLVAYFGKRGENAVTGYTALTGDLQEERDRLDRLLVERDAKLAERDARLAELSMLRAADQAELTRLRATIIQLGGHP